jgi:hypothetical protein
MFFKFTRKSPSAGSPPTENDFKKYDVVMPVFDSFYENSFKSGLDLVETKLLAAQVPVLFVATKCDLYHPDTHMTGVSTTSHSWEYTSAYQNYMASLSTYCLEPPLISETIDQAGKKFMKKIVSVVKEP